MIVFYIDDWFELNCTVLNWYFVSSFYSWLIYYIFYYSYLFMLFACQKYLFWIYFICCSCLWLLYCCYTLCCWISFSNALLKSLSLFSISRYKSFIFCANLLPLFSCYVIFLVIYCYLLANSRVFNSYYRVNIFNSYYFYLKSFFIRYNSRSSQPTRFIDQARRFYEPYFVLVKSQSVRPSFYYCSLIWDINLASVFLFSLNYSLIDSILVFSLLFSTFFSSFNFVNKIISFLRFST